MRRPGNSAEVAEALYALYAALRDSGMPSKLITWDFDVDAITTQARWTTALGDKLMQERLLAFSPELDSAEVNRYRRTWHDFAAKVNAGQFAESELQHFIAAWEGSARAARLYLAAIKTFDADDDANEPPPRELLN